MAVEFMSAGPAETVLDFETKAPRLDANGQPIYSVPLFAISPDSYDTLTVKVAGEPKGIGNFTPVKVTNLIASTWDISGNHSVSFKTNKRVREAGQFDGLAVNRGDSLRRLSELSTGRSPTTASCS